MRWKATQPMRNLKCQSCLGSTFAFGHCACDRARRCLNTMQIGRMPSPRMLMETAFGVGQARKQVGACPAESSTLCRELTYLAGASAMPGTRTPSRLMEARLAEAMSWVVNEFAFVPGLRRCHDPAEMVLGRKRHDILNGGAEVGNVASVAKREPGMAELRHRFREGKPSRPPRPETLGGGAVQIWHPAQLTPGLNTQWRSRPAGSDMDLPFLFRLRVWPRARCSGSRRDPPDVWTSKTLLRDQIRSRKPSKIELVDRTSGKPWMIPTPFPFRTPVRGPLPGVA